MFTLSFEMIITIGLPATKEETLCFFFNITAIYQQMNILAKQ